MSIVTLDNCLGIICASSLKKFKNAPVSGALAKTQDKIQAICRRFSQIGAHPKQSMEYCPRFSSLAYAPGI